MVVTSSGVAHGGPIPQVHTIMAIRQDHASTITLTGEVVARHRINLSFRIAGQVSEILVQVGDHVEAGTLLARLDPTLQQSDLLAAEASTRAALAQLNLAQSEYDRISALFDKGFSTRVAMDQSKVALTLAKGAVEVLNSQLALARNAYEFTEIIAPVRGTVTGKSTEEGQSAQAAQTIFTFAANGARDAVFEVHEGAISQYGSDVAIQLSLDGDPDITADCVLREVSPVINPFTGTVRVICGIINPPPGFTLASVVRGQASLRSRPLLSIPWVAMTSLNGAPAVWILNKETRTVTIRRVEVERYEVGVTLVRSGIETGEIIITDGARFLRDGIEVLVLEGIDK